MTNLFTVSRRLRVLLRYFITLGLGAKRAKVEIVEVSPKKRVTSARRKKNLSLLPTVPFDVLMEVRILYIFSSPRLSNAFANRC